MSGMKPQQAGEEKRKKKKMETEAEEEGAMAREPRTRISLSTKSMAIKWHRLPELFLQLPIFLLHVKRQKAVTGSWYKGAPVAEW